MKFAARIAFSFFLIVFCFFLVTAKANAQVIPTNTNPDVPNNLHTWTQNVMIEVASSLSCLISGIDPIDTNHKCLGVDIKTKKIGYVDNGGGAIGVMGNLIAMTFTPPAHTSDYVRYIAGNFGIAKPAYAQGVGFQSLSPLLPIWTAFRNITYLLFVIVFVVIGFAIMLRVHIDPRTVMTIENQIPKIIIALILVTFSFAIAGFLIDLMWVFIYLVIGIFSTIPGVDSKQLANASQQIQGENAISVFNNFVGFKDLVFNSAGGVRTIILDLLTKPFPPPPGGGNFWDFLNLATVLQNIVGILIAGIGGFLAFIIITVAVLVALFRLWFTLISAYVFILLDIVFVPFWIIMGLVPGAGISFTAWLREICSELLAFPATIVMFLIGNAFINLSTTNEATGQRLFAPPLIGNANVPGAFEALIGLGIILLTPSVASMMKSALKAPKLDVSAIGQAVGAGTALPTAAVRQTTSTIIATKEPIINTKTQRYEERSLGKALLGRLGGRG